MQMYVFAAPEAEWFIRLKYLEFLIAGLFYRCKFEHGSGHTRQTRFCLPVVRWFLLAHLQKAHR